MRTNEGILRDILRLVIWFPFRWLVNIFPVHLSFFIFKLMGDLHFYAVDKKRRKLLTTLNIYLGPTEKAFDYAKRYYENHYLDRLHIFLYPKLTLKKKLCKYVVPENIALLDQALRDGNGVLIVQPHFGPVQITLLFLALEGYAPIQIGFPTDRGLSMIGRSIAFKYRVRYEQMLPAPIVEAQRYLGRVYKHLAKGGVVLTTGDGAGREIYLGEQEELSFMNEKRKIPLGPATWALKTGATYLPAFIVPENCKRFRIIFESPVSGVYNDIGKDRIHITEQFISLTENYIRKYPYCWHFWDEL